MSRNSVQLKFAHIEINLTLSENDSSWYDPRVQQHFSFAIPVDLLDVKKLADLLKLQLDAMHPAFDAEKERWEAEEKAKAESQ